MYIDEKKKIINISLFLFAFILLGLFAFFFFNSYQKNIIFKSQISCQGLGVDYNYDKRTNSCEKISLLNQEKDKSDKYLCDFTVSYTSTEARHIDGRDTELIASLEEKCMSGEDILSKFACLNLETEKNNEYHITYYDLEGVLKTNSDEHLDFIGFELNTANAKRVLLGTEVLNFDKDLRSGEETPFSVTIAIDRSDENIAKFFEKEDGVLIDTYPVYSTCR